jgi:hypothetical protein
MKIIAFWNEDKDDDSNTGYMCECPSCSDLTPIGDDFVWNGPEGMHRTKDKYVCECCDSEDDHYIFRK